MKVSGVKQNLLDTDYRDRRIHGRISFCVGLKQFWLQISSCDIVSESNVNFCTSLQNSTAIGSDPDCIWVRIISLISQIPDQCIESCWK